MGERADSQMPPPIAPIAPIDVDLAGQRLLMEVRAACEACATFPEQVVAGLRTALERFAAQSDLHCLLPTPEDCADLAHRQIYWQEVFAAYLRDAAKRRDGAPATPAFLERTLMDNVGAQIGDWLAAGDLQPLGVRVAALAELILTYYSEFATNGTSGPSPEGQRNPSVKLSSTPPPCGRRQAAPSCIPTPGGVGAVGQSGDPAAAV